MKLLGKVAIALAYVNIFTTNATTIIFKGTFGDCNASSSKHLNAHNTDSITEINLSRSQSMINIVNSEKLSKHYDLKNIKLERVIINDSPSSYSQLNRLHLNIYSKYNVSTPLSSEHIDTNKVSDTSCIPECLHNLFQSIKQPEDSQCHLCYIF